MLSNPAQIATIAIPKSMSCANFCNPVLTTLAGVPTTPIFTEGVATEFAERFPARCDRFLVVVGLCGLDGELTMFLSVGSTFRLLNVEPANTPQGPYSTISASTTSSMSVSL